LNDFVTKMFVVTCTRRPGPDHTFKFRCLAGSVSYDDTNDVE
jgi:hypothetical protein